MPFKSILVNTSAWPTESVAIDAAARIASVSGASLNVFDVVSDLSWIAQHISGGWEDTIESYTGSKRQRISELAASLSSQGLTASGTIAKGRLSSAIIKQVHDGGHDLVVKAAEKSSKRSGFIGSTDMRLIHECPCATLILRPDEEAGFQKVAVAADVLDQHPVQAALDLRALQIASSMQEPSSPISLIYALPPMATAIRISKENSDVVSSEQIEKWDSELRTAARVRLDEMQGQVADGCVESHILIGDPKRAIPEFVNSHGVDLLVVGSVARCGMEGLFLGNTAELILERVNSSVLVLKPTE